MEKIMGDYIQTRDIVMCERHMDEGLTESCLYCHIEKLEATIKRVSELLEETGIMGVRY